MMMIFVGFLEEIIFRGFLFRGIAKDNLKEAVIISNESDSNIRESLRGSEDNVDAAAEIIIETVL